MRPLSRLPISSDVGDVSGDVRRLFEDLLKQRPERRHQITGECLPLLDVFETHDAIDLLLDLPGVSAASIRVLVKGGVVIIAGEKDHIMPPSVNWSNAEHYVGSPARTSYHEFAGRDHWTCGAPGWEAVADYALQWAEEFGGVTRADVGE